MKKSNNIFWCVKMKYAKYYKLINSHLLWRILMKLRVVMINQRMIIIKKLRIKDIIFGLLKLIEVILWMAHLIDEISVIHLLLALIKLLIYLIIL